jgi:polysaccharide export outer membrane protein
MRKSFIGCAALLALAACASTPTGKSFAGRSCTVPEALISARADYRISVGDRVQVNVFDENQLGGEYLVGTNGTISMPLLGAISAEGLTVDEFIASIETSLTSQLINQPRVNAQLVAFRPYYVLGEVAKPGAYPYQLQTDLYAALASAGGFSYRAREDCVLLRPGNGGEELLVPVGGRLPLAPGDVIVVDARNF